MLGVSPIVTRRSLLSLEPEWPRAPLSRVRSALYRTGGVAQRNCRIEAESNPSPFPLIVRELLTDLVIYKEIPSFTRKRPILPDLIGNKIADPHRMACLIMDVNSKKWIRISIDWHSSRWLRK